MPFWAQNETKLPIKEDNEINGFIASAALPFRWLAHIYFQATSINSSSKGVVTAEKIVDSSMLVAAGPVKALNCCDIR